MLKSVVRGLILGLPALGLATQALAQDGISLFRPQPVAAPSGITGNPAAALGMRPDSVGAVGYFAIAPEGASSLRSGGPKRIRVPLPQGAGTAVCDVESKAAAPDEFVLSGAAADGSVGSVCSLVLGNGTVSGLVDTETGRYRVVPLGGGTHAVAEVRTEAFPAEADPLVLPGTSAQDSAPAQDNELCDVKPGGQPKTFGPIRVLIAYTTAAKQASRDIKTDMTELMNQFNMIMSDKRTGGNFSVTAELAAAVEVNYSESSAKDMEVDLRNFSNKNHPVFGAIHRMRDQVKADIIHLIIKGRPQVDPCGIGWLNLRLTENAAISASDRDCALNNFSFSHEIGHNMGMNHDRFVSPGSKPGPQETNFGQVLLQCLFRTTMAYDDACRKEQKSCRRALVYATPHLTISKQNVPECQKVPIGRPLNAQDAAYNVEQLCRAAPKVVNFR